MQACVIANVYFCSLNSGVLPKHNKALFNHNSTFNAPIPSNAHLSGGDCSRDGLNNGASQHENTSAVQHTISYSEHSSFVKITRLQLLCVKQDLELSATDKPVLLISVRACSYWTLALAPPSGVGYRLFLPLIMLGRGLEPVGGLQQVRASYGR